MKEMGHKILIPQAKGHWIFSEGLCSFYFSNMELASCGTGLESDGSFVICKQGIHGEGRLAQKRWFIRIFFLFPADLPEIEQEAEVGQSHSELQPPPVGKGIGHARQYQEPNRKGHLVTNPHCPAIAQANKFCN